MRQFWRVSELLALYVETVRPDCSLLINSIHWLVALVARNLHLVVLDNILLDNGFAGAQGGCLCSSMVVESSLGDEAIVAWDVRCRFCCAHSQFVVLVASHLSILIQLCTRVVAVRSNGLLELSLEVASF